MIIFLLFSVFSFIIITWMITSKKSMLDPPDLPNRLPIIGHAHLFLSSNLWNLVQKISRVCFEKGGVIKYYIGSRITYVITDPDDFMTVANTCLDKDYIYAFAKPWLGDGLLLGEAQIWKKHRKLLNPAFNQHVLNSFVGIFNSQARRLADQLAQNVGELFNQEPWLRQNNLETICLTSSGSDFEDYNALQKEYIPCLGELLEIFTKRFQTFWLHSDFIFNMTKLKSRQDELVNNILQLCTSIIQKRRFDIKSTIPNKTKVKPFMDLIMELADETGCFTDKQILEETNNIVAAGHDTSASILTLTLMLLGAHLEVQEKVLQEILEVLGPDKDVDKEDFSKLVYTDAVLNETIRLYPIAPIVARYVNREVKLKNYTLKPKSSCFLSVLSLNRHPMWGPDADQFRPERWLEPTAMANQKYFAGFSLGRRSCIGKTYAMMSMKAVISHLVRRYRIKSDMSNFSMKMDIMLRPDVGHHITLELRNKQL